MFFQILLNPSNFCFLTWIMRGILNNSCIYILFELVCKSLITTLNTFILYSDFFQYLLKCILLVFSVLICAPHYTKIVLNRKCDVDICVRACVRVSVLLFVFFLSPLHTLLAMKNYYRLHFCLQHKMILTA